MDLIDGAINIVAPAPTVGLLEDGDDPFLNSALLPITASNFGGTIDYQVVQCGGAESKPADTDPRWYTAGSYGILSSSVLGVADNIGSGVGIYGRARTVSLMTSSRIVLPILWTYASNHVDFDLIGAPTALGVGQITVNPQELHGLQGQTLPLNCFLHHHQPPLAFAWQYPQEQPHIP